MKIKSKIVLFVCAFALIFSVLSVSCFADSSTLSVGSTYTFSSSPTLSDSLGEFYDFDVTYEILLEIDGVLYDTFVVSNDFITIASGSSAIYFNRYTEGWDFVPDLSSSEYVEIDPPTFTLVSISTNISLDFVSWFLTNISSVSDSSFYSQIFSSISDGVFGVGADLTPEQVMTLTLISTILSYAFILLPLLLVIGFVLGCFRL